jgi:hypothetical protein
MSWTWWAETWERTVSTESLASQLCTLEHTSNLPRNRYTSPLTMGRGVQVLQHDARFVSLGLTVISMGQFLCARA